MMEKPEVWGAQELSSKEVTMRIVAKTAPMRQWEVARELRARVKAALDEAGVAPAGPDTIVITAPPVPGSAVPGSAVPGSAVPGSAVPGSAVPGSAVPGSANGKTRPGAREDDPAGSPP
jgi:hypothetical protein